MAWWKWRCSLYGMSCTLYGMSCTLWHGGGVLSTECLSSLLLYLLILTNLLPYNFLQSLSLSSHQSYSYFSSVNLKKEKYQGHIAVKRMDKCSISSMCIPGVCCNKSKEIEDTLL